HQQLDHGGMMSDTAAQLAEITARLQKLEDEVAITRLIASYGPLVDGGCADEVGAIWTEDGVYDVDEFFYGSRADIVDMVNGEPHQKLIGNGSAHFLGPASVNVDGDDAVAVCYSVLIVRHKDRPLLVRAGTHHWEFVRTTEGWKCTR